MRRKSPRTAAPKTTPEKTKSPAKKSRRSTRRKKQSTSESSDDSQDEQSLQEIAKQVSAEKSKSPVKEDSSEAVWKVTTSDTSSGEIQKLKISLTRPSPSTPERSSRRKRRKSEGGGGVGGDERNEESSTQEDEKSSEVEEKEEKKGKGKSKGKHKSKIEQTPQTNEQEAEMQSEISENVQVTAQSPPIDIPVDNATTLVNDCENNEEQPTENDACDQGDANNVVVAAADLAKNVDGDAEKQTELDENQLVQASPLQTETKITVENETEQASVCDQTPTDQETTVVVQEEVEKEKSLQEADNTEGTTTTTIEEDVVKTETETEETPQQEEENRESLPSEIAVAETTTTATTTESFVEYMEVDVSENEHFRNLTEEIAEEQKVEVESIKQQRKRKWGDNQALQKYFTNVFKIDVETIKDICSEVKFLDENEVKLESTAPEERKKSSEQNSKKSERKISLDETVKPELKTQISTTNSEELNDFETNANIIAMNRKISIVDDTASKLKPPPSPAKNPISEILFITNLVRPFTIKQLKELLERTGKIKENGFWTDHIKSKCYVQYESLEEAEATRNALHGVQWPIGNGKKLIIEYGTVEEMEKAKNPPPQTTPEAKPSEKEVETPVIKQSQEEPEQIVDDRREKKRKETQMREWDIGKEDLDRRRSRSKERSDRKRHTRRSESPADDFIARKQKKQEEAAPQKLMDDLFQKTKATPCIYWLPLTPEEIAMKQQQRLIRMEEHKRRLEEAVRNRGDFNRGGPYRRRYD